MKKSLLLMAVCLFSLGNLQAQTWSEWFRQRKTQIKYLVAQIAVYKVYGEYTAKGYGIARQGLTAIGDIKGSDLTLHSEYLRSLQNVSPAVKKYWKVAAIISLQRETVQVCHEQQKAIRGSDQFTPEEIAYTDKVRGAVLADCAHLGGALLALITDNTAEMKDDERLKGIDRIYSNVQEAYTFINDFGSQTSVLSGQRKGEGSTIKNTALFLKHPLIKVKTVSNEKVGIDFTVRRLYFDWQGRCAIARGAATAP